MWGNDKRLNLGDWFFRGEYLAMLKGYSGLIILLAQESGGTPGGTQGTIWDSGIEPGSTAWKASTLPTTYIIGATDATDPGSSGSSGQGGWGPTPLLCLPLEIFSSGFWACFQISEWSHWSREEGSVA